MISLLFRLFFCFTCNYNIVYGFTGKVLKFNVKIQAYIDRIINTILNLKHKLSTSVYSKYLIFFLFASHFNWSGPKSYKNIDPPLGCIGRRVGAQTRRFLVNIPRLVQIFIRFCNKLHSAFSVNGIASTKASLESITTCHCKIRVPKVRICRSRAISRVNVLGISGKKFRLSPSSRLPVLPTNLSLPSRYPRQSYLLQRFLTIQ